MNTARNATSGYPNMLSSANTKLLINAFAFQIVWFICVQGHNIYAAIATIGLIGLNQYLFKTNAKVWLVLLLFSLVGYLGDTAITQFIDLQYSSSFETFAPIWLLSLWFAFSTTLNHSMNWLFSSPFIALVAGLLLVPLSYLAGITLSDSVINDPYWIFVLAEGVWWALLLVTYQRFIYPKETTHA